MDSELSTSILRASFLVCINNNCKLFVPKGALETIVISALAAGSDVSILSVDNDCYRIK